VPLGLFFGTSFGWQMPFILLAVAGTPLLFITPYALPPLDAHLRKAQSHPMRAVIETFSEPNHWNAFALIIALMVGSFTVFPYLADFLVKNVGLSESYLPLLYITGGALSLVTSPFIGRLADRFGKLAVYRIIAPISALFFLGVTHLPAVPVAAAVCIFGAMMVFNVGRMIPATALVTSSVEPHRRGGFLSANSSVQHIAAGIGAWLGGQVLEVTADGRLGRFGLVGWIAAAATLLTVWLAGRIRIVDAAGPSAENLSLAAAAEASADAPEALVTAAEE
jgi:predicted MFS family arabinose efflux permease